MSSRQQGDEGAVNNGIMADDNFPDLISKSSIALAEGLDLFFSIHIFLHQKTSKEAEVLCFSR
jgi:hypothetical protein